MRTKDRTSFSYGSINVVENSFGSELSGYFLGGRTIVSKRISHLLISSSFGVNAILYSVWLGYLMGVWALLIQIAWCLSFILLSRFATRIYNFSNLHDFLGSHFGKITQRIASTCSIVGLLYFAGWEIAIARSGIESILANSGYNVANIPVLITCLVAFAILYTVLGGQRANGLINSIFNIIKFALLGFIVISVFRIEGNINPLRFNTLVPSFSTAIASIGFIGLITNFLFNTTWQFVDNSTWQTISSSEKNDSQGLRKTLLKTSGGILFAYTLGTFLGSFMRTIPGLNSDNIFASISTSFGNGTYITVALVILILLSMVSLIDGVSLSVAQSFTIDVGLGKIYAKVFKRHIGIRFARIITVLVGIFSAWGVQAILNIFGVSIFNFVYILVVAQLCLLGPVLVGLLLHRRSVANMWLPIVIGLLFGLSSSIIGGAIQIAWLTDAAGTIAALTSTLMSLVLYCFAPLKRNLN